LWYEVADSIGGDYLGRDVCRQHAREVSVDRAVAGHAGRLDEDQPPRAERARNPCGDTVARDIPGVRQRIGVAQPAVRRKHRNRSRVDRGYHLRRTSYDHAAAQARRDEVRVLIHGEHRHPVRR